MHEQQRIAEILDAVDESILATQLELAKLLAAVDSSMQHALSALDYDKLRSVNDFYSIDSGLTLGAYREALRLKAPYLRVANIQRGHIDLKDVTSIGILSREVERYLLRAGDLLIVEGHADPNEIGRCAQVVSESSSLLFQNHLFRLRSSSVIPEFGLTYFNSEAARRYWWTNAATSSGLYTINSKLLSRMPFPLVDHERQESVARLLRASAGAAADASRELAKLRLLKKGLMDDLLTGKVRVCDVDGC